MSAQLPHVRVHAPNGVLLVRDELSLCFYMRRSHQEMAKDVLTSLNAYLKAVGSENLNRYCDLEGEWQELDSRQRESQLLHLLEAPLIHLAWGHTPGWVGEYELEYWGRPLHGPDAPEDSGLVSMVRFWLPTEFLEKHGPGRVRELAMELAAPLPFNSGYAGLAFNAATDPLGFDARTRALCFRHPGMSIHDGYADVDIGTRVIGVNWLTFLGQPVLGELGGPAELRARLNTPGTTLQELEHERVLITLGPWPDAGDTEQGRDLLAYRELTLVLEPWLYEPPPWKRRLRRWTRRFLD